MSFIQGVQLACLSMQEKDGFSSQLDSLRTKVANLARELAESQDTDKVRGGRVQTLEGNVARLEAEAESAQQAWSREKLLLQQVRPSYLISYSNHQQNLPNQQGSWLAGLSSVQASFSADSWPHCEDL
jgi:outer membrane murein-binding lipoprotein Lpp